MTHLRHKLSAVAFALGAALAATGAWAATATWTFDLPATASWTPPYPVVATVTATDIAGGVRFVLDPNESSPGYNPASQSFIERLTIVFNGGATAPTGFAALSAQSPVQAMTFYNPPPDGLDAGYFSAPYDALAFDWCSGPPKACTFTADETSTWEVYGSNVNVAAFLPPAQGISPAPKPQPIFGVISVTAYDLPQCGPGTNCNPTPSNWVALQVPEPGTYALLLAGASVIGFVLRRRRQS